MKGTMDDSTLNILVIDDNEAMRRLFFDLLSPYGYQIILASSAEEGLGQLPYYPFSVAFLDHNLPGMEGLVLGEYLKRHNPALEIALVTGDNSARVQRLCDQYGIAYVAKPFERSQLRAIIARAETKAASKDMGLEKDTLNETPRIADYFDALPDVFELPTAPKRLKDQLAWQIQESLSRMRMHGPSEADRTIAFSGLLTARVLGLKLPRTRKGLTMWEEYDELVVDWGCEPVFRPTED
jgi:two-component system, chemotaxis family, chemotaxis protein CheY